MPTTGRVIIQQKSHCVVDTESGRVQARPCGALRNRRPCVGDIVDIEITNRDTMEGLIRRVHKRKSFVPRPPLANMDQFLLVATLTEPPLDLETCDRFLFFAEVYGFRPVIVFNKLDLLSERQREELEGLGRIYAAIGYTVLETSAATGYQLDSLAENCIGRHSFLAGVSGVGKTTLLAKLFPQHEFRTAPLSKHTGQGVHTTTNVSLLGLSQGGYIADTPGSSLIDLPVVAQHSVISYFPELAANDGSCRFNNCIHAREPGCRVKELVEEKQIASFRYEHYLKFYHEMKAESSRY